MFIKKKVQRRNEGNGKLENKNCNKVLKEKAVGLKKKIVENGIHVTDLCF